MTEKQLLASISNVISQFAQLIEKLYQLVARTFCIYNTGPIGCLPYAVKYYPPKPENIDQNGCVNSDNEVAEEFNRQLKDRVSRLMKQLQDAVVTCSDIFTAKYSLISEAKKQGFDRTLGYCCGHYGDCHVQCVKRQCCTLSWDAIHYSQAENQGIANRILDGFLSDPPTPINEACHRPVHL